MNVIVKNPKMKVAKLSQYFGAEITGIDLRNPVDDATRQQLVDILEENVALVIRGQEFTATQFLAAAALFGEIMEDQNRNFIIDGLPLVSVLSNRNKNSEGKQAKVASNATWHTDHTNQERPPKFTTLYPVELPDRGGGTSLYNMRMGFEELPEDLQKRLLGMKANTCLRGSAAKNGNPDTIKAQQEAKRPLTVQPIVRTHPVNGSKAVWFHPSKTENIIGMGPEDTQEFLADLTQKAIKPEKVYVHEWKLGDMLIWDNRSAMHKAGFDYDPNQHRMLYRILVRGDRPV